MSRTVRFWVVQHPQTKKYADIWTFYYMGPEYGGHHWVGSLKEALPFSSKERATEWWNGNKRLMGWTDMDDYEMGCADVVEVTALPEDVQRGRTDSDAILASLT